MAYEVDHRVINRWAARLIPATLMGVVGYATYVLVVRLCVRHLLRDSDPRPGAAVAILVIYFLIFLLMATSYFRILYVVNFEPGYIPLGPAAPKNLEPEKRPTMRSRRESEISGPEYGSSNTRPGPDPSSNPDSPGLEQFYTKDVFVCESDGRPRWCHRCANWKPDRTHHCSDIGRCVRKEDHFCPWVGGVVGETSFKFFIQFVTYTCTYCTFLVVVMAIYVHEQIVSKQPGAKVDPQLGAIIGLGAFFGLFTAGMVMTSTSNALGNLTTIEHLNSVTKVWQLAVIIPNWSPTTGTPSASTGYATVTYPLPIISEKPKVATTDSGNASDGPSQSSSSNSSPNPHSLRDSQATRTFAILHLGPGQNPWDLGALGNWKSVMGNSILDWFLPIRHSPCSNHESPESQFPLGRWVDELRVGYGLLPQSGVRSPRPRASHRQERHARKRAKDLEMQNVEGQGALSTANSTSTPFDSSVA